jgi:fermentation-respiration switch protein FrsA (DUF1100 family)
LRRTIILAGLFLSFAFTTAQATQSDGLEGTWEGFLEPAPLSELRVILRVEKGPGGNLHAIAECPEVKSQPAAEFAEVSVKEGKVTLGSNKDGREFHGTLNPAGTEIAGDWKGSGGSRPIKFTRVDGPVTRAEIWEGTLEVTGGIKLRLTFHALKGKDGAIRAYMDSPDQGAYSLKVNRAEISKEVVRFTLTFIGEFEGKLDATGESAVGKWKQGGTSLPLTLKKVAEASEVRRPQTPKPPFPYVSEEVAYASRAKGVQIAGTLTLPEGDGPFPAVLLITGSGPQDRDETLLGHKPFLVLADDLTRRGIVVLRVDDRGVGASTGNQATATSDFLKGHRRIDPRRIGLIGHSEGGLIAPIVATRSPDVAFITLLAGTGVPGDRILSSQLILILKASGADEATIRRSSEAQTRYLAIAQEVEDPKQAAEKLKAASEEIAKALPEAERKAMTEADPEGARLAVLTTPWFRYFLRFDPGPTLSKVRCPVLAINGEKDTQVPAKENLEAIERALKSGGNDRVTTRELPGLNHLFQPCNTGAPSEYATIEETFSPAALRVIGDWIIDHTRPK